MSSVSKTFQELITFSRSTNGTYVNSAGYIANTPVVNYLPYSNQFENVAWLKINSFVQQNLFLYSQEFDNVNWGTLNVATPTANTTIAPDGTLTADTVTASAGTASRNISQSSGGLTLVPMTASVYAKANTLGFLQIFHGSASSAYANFNLTTGVIGTVGAVTAAMTSAGNGWYRCSISFTPSAPSNIRLALISSATAVYNESWAAAGTESIFLWGAQVVQGSVPGDYRATTTAALPVLYPDYTGALRVRQVVRTTSAAIESGLQQIGSTLVAGTSVTYSVVAKAGNSGNYLYLRNIYIDASLPAGIVTFNLETGTIVYTGAYYTGKASIVSLGNGYYRCSITGDVVSSPVVNRIDVGLTTNSIGSVGGTLGDYLYIADAQLEPGTSVGPYYDTSATLTYAPRLDYDPVTLAAKGLLIEEQRVNLLYYSSQFDNTSFWGTINATVGPNTGVSPDGTVSADTLTSNGVAGIQRVTQTITQTGVSTFSIYAKAGSAQFLQLLHASDGNCYANFNLASGVLGTFGTGSTSTITNAGSGWYRCTLSFNVLSNSNWQIYIAPSASAAYGQLFTATVASLFLWGAQSEAGAYATSYIPTTTSQLTRVADVVTISTLSPWYTYSAGTVYMDWDVINIDTTTRRQIFNVTDFGTQRLSIRALDVGANFPIGAIGTGATVLSLSGVAYTANTPVKYAVAYGSNEAAAQNGSITSTDVTASSVTPNPPLPQLGGNSTNAILNGHLRRITFYPQRLTNAQLQSITA